MQGKFSPLMTPMVAILSGRNCFVRALTSACYPKTALQIPGVLHA